MLPYYFASLSFTTGIIPTKIIGEITDCIAVYYVN
jgi:hypothetical protein